MDEDRNAALAYLDWLREDDATRCPRCRTRERDWIDPATGKELRTPAWMVKVNYCPGCIMLAEAHDDIEPDDPDRAGKHPVFVPNDPDRVHPVDTDD